MFSAPDFHPMSSILFLANAASVGVTSLLLVSALERELQGFAAKFVAWMLGCVCVVVATGVFLGAIGYLSSGGFFTIHALVMGLGLARRRGTLETDLFNSLNSISGSLVSLKAQRHLHWVLLGLGIFCAATAFFAATGHVGIYDSMTYRLSRVAHWLQEGSVGFMVTNDQRQNYMPVVPDLAMAWILSAGDQGYAGAALAQWLGGVLLLRFPLIVPLRLFTDALTGVLSRCWK